MYTPPLMFLTDGYKLDHRRQFPVGTRMVYSNHTPRGSRIKGVDRVVFFGLQYFLKQYLGHYAEVFFDTPKDQVLKEYQDFLDGYLGPNDIGTDHIAALHELGYMPLEYWAVPEGTPVPMRMPFYTVHSTHDDFYWLTNYFETLQSSVMWMPITSATTAWQYRKLIDGYTKAQGADLEFVQWQGHDFSFRGMACPEAAILSGAAHLISFTGTDTVPAINMLQRFYGAEGLVGGSVPATEHAVMCAGGEISERETYDRLLKLYPSGIVSVVSDTWDYWNVLMNILPDLHGEIMARPGKLVIRPDSGDPVKIICGDPEAKPGTPEHKGSVEVLWDLFGGTETEQGFRMLDSHIGLIYGDSITYERCEQILGGLNAKGFAASNVVFGIGSFTYQYVTRDTYGQAIKATAAVVGDTEHMLYKDPKTDDGLKRSARGRISLNLDENDKIVMTDALDAEQWAKMVNDESSVYRRVWVDGEFHTTYTFEQVRENLRNAS